MKKCTEGVKPNSAFYVKFWSNAASIRIQNGLVADGETGGPEGSCFRQHAYLAKGIMRARACSTSCPQWCGGQESTAWQ